MTSGGSTCRSFLACCRLPGRLTVDMGCGEGRLGRVLAGAGHRVVGCDAAFAMVKAAAWRVQGLSCCGC